MDRSRAPAVNLRTEMVRLLRALDGAGVPYALCGGLAMAVHGWPRAMLDIDLLVQEQRLPEVRRLAASQGFNRETGFLNLAAGRLRLFHLVKFAGEEFLPLDLLLVTPELASAWNSRISMPTLEGSVCVVSVEGLIQMKSLRKNGTDMDDIRRLKGEADAAD